MSSFLIDFIKDQELDFIGLQETIKKDYSQAFFRKIDPLNRFDWKWSASVGRVGGILGGFSLSRFKILDTVASRFYVKTILMDLKLQMKWALVIIYGVAQECDKEEFLADLGLVCGDQTMPLLIGGDFNIIRFASEKNKAWRPSRWSDTFNSIINTYELRELDMDGGQFTWSNNQKNPTLEKLDRFLMSKSWEMIFPLTTVHKLSRDVSDHCPIILDTMKGRTQKSKDFRFDKRWLKEESFMMRVSKI